jgi:hypothetical protein
VDPLARLAQGQAIETTRINPDGIFQGHYRERRRQLLILFSDLENQPNQMYPKAPPARVNRSGRRTKLIARVNSAGASFVIR